MKKIIYLFALFSCVQIVLAQQDSSYFPLAVHNKWEFIGYNSGSEDSLKMEIIKDTMINNQKYYAVNFYEKYKSQNNVISDTSYIWYLKKEINGDVSIKENEIEKILYKFSGNEGDCFISTYFPVCIHSKTRKDIFFDFQPGYFLKATYHETAVGPAFYQKMNKFSSYIKFFLIKYSIDGRTYQYPTLNVKSETNDLLPNEIIVDNNYPNPFNSNTKFTFQIKKNFHVIMKIYDVLGKEIITLKDEDMSLGKYIANWDGRDNQGLSVSTGLYFVSCLFKSNEKPTQSFLTKILYQK